MKTKKHNRWRLSLHHSIPGFFQVHGKVEALFRHVGNVFGHCVEGHGANSESGSDDVVTDIARWDLGLLPLASRLRILFYNLHFTRGSGVFWSFRRATFRILPCRRSWLSRFHLHMKARIWRIFISKHHYKSIILVVLTIERALLLHFTAPATRPTQRTGASLYFCPHTSLAHSLNIEVHISIGLFTQEIKLTLPCRKMVASSGLFALCFGAASSSP